MESRPEIVMSGISGRFPSSDNMEEYEYNLYNGVDMVTADDTRWPMGLFNLPHRNGKLKSSAIERFDAEFFDIPDKVVNFVDPQHRMLLELTYEALVDAGHDPSDLRGSNTGFFWGSCFLETHADFDDPMRTPAIERNTISTVSQFFDWRGPVLQTDTACNSSLNAVNMAVQALRTGMCDRVLVAGSNTCFRPLVSLRFRDLKMISKDGTCKCLDESANGYCRSEAIVAVFLELSKDAKRAYARVLNSKSGSDGFKEEGITFPSMARQRQLAQETYDEVGLDPADIGYIEAHVTGTTAGDPVEMEAMCDLICSKRKEPLLVGCVKSQVGHAEGASGLCSIAKALLVLQNRSIPPNIYYHSPNPNIEGLMNGKMKAVTRITPLPGNIIPVNSFGFGGANTHVVLQGLFSDDGKGSIMSTPRLVLVCGRTVEAVRHIKKKIENERRLQTNEFLTLLDTFSNAREDKFKFRSYLLVTKCPCSGKFIFESGDIRTVSHEKPKSMFLSTDVDPNGNTSNHFTATFAFQAKLELFSTILKPLGVDLMSIASNGSSNLMELSVFRVATQIATIDVLNEIGVTINGLCGNEVSLLVKSYFESKMCAQDVLLNAANKSLVSSSVSAPNGSIVLDLETGLQPLGELYVQGIEVRGSKLASPVTYPMPSSTPTLSSLLKWNHSKLFSIKPYLVQDNFFQKSRNIRFFCDYRALDEAFMYDHKIDGRTLYPASGYLMVAWIAFTKFMNCSAWDYAVEFKDVAFHRATVLSKGTETALYVRYNEDSGKFVVVESDTVVVTGTINFRSEMSIAHPERLEDAVETEPITLPAKHVYKEFRVRGYDYGQYFQGIDEARSDGRRAKLIWRDVMPKTVQEALTIETEDEQAVLWLRSLVPFLDAMFQLDILKEENDSRSLFVPTRIESLIVSPELLRQNIQYSPKFVDALTMSEASLLDTFGRVDSLIWTKGLVVKGLKCTNLKRKAQAVRVQRYENTPLDEHVTFGHRDRLLVENYRAACLAAARGRDVPHSFKVDEPKYALLRSLSSSLNCLGFSKMNSTVSKVDLSHDLLVGNFEDDFYFPERFILPIMSLAVNNLPLQVDVMTPFDVLEVVGTSGHSLNGRFHELFDQLLIDDTLRLSYSILSSNPDILPPNVRENKSTKVHTWTPDNYGAIPASMDLIIYRSSQSDPSDAVAKLTSLLKVGGFLFHLSREDEPLQQEFGLEIGHPSNSVSLLKAASAAGLTVVGEKRLCDSLPVVGHFFRKAAVTDPDNVRVVEVGVCDYDRWYENLKLFLREENTLLDKRVWLVNPAESNSSSSQNYRGISPIVGLVKSLKFEEGGERLRSLIDLSATEPIDIFNPKYAEVLRRDLVVNVRDEMSMSWGSYETHNIPEEEMINFNKVVEHCYLKALKPGDMSSLTWVESNVEHKANAMSNSKSSGRLVNVHYSALNFRDIMFASGRLDSEAIPGIHADVAQDSILGLEYSGTDRTTGQRLMGITPYKGLASTVLAMQEEEDFIWPVPEQWSLEDAATVPVVYATALYALVIRGKLATGETVLIHSGCGGVGLAAINVALSMGCKVYTTVGSASKRAYLVDKWPQLRGAIFNSRQLSFEEDILTATDGKGVDVVLNSLAEDMLQASLRCLADNGRFLEIGKVDFIQNNQLFSHQLGSNQSFHGVLLDALFKYSSKTYFPPRLVAERRQLRTLVLAGLENGSVRPLDRTLFSRDRVEEAFRFMASGKHVGKVLVQMKEEGRPSSSPIRAATYCYPNKVYIVLGGAGGFGLEVVQWLGQKGAKKIVIASRRGLREPYQHYAISRLRKKGVQVTIDSSDITSEAGCRQLLEMAEKEGPVGGLFNPAVVYKDALYDVQPLSQFREVCGPKAHASLHFDVLTRESCPELDYFVTWSSLSCARGNAGQTNYSYANSLMDSICERRRADGLPGLSVQWGVVGDVGTVAESASSNDMILLGSQAQRMHSCLDVIDKCVQGPAPVCISYVKADKDDGQTIGSDSVDILNVITRLLGLKDMSNLDQEITLGGLGVDSLIAVEIKQALDKTLGTQTSVREVRDLTIGRIIQMSAEQYAVPAAPGP